MSDLRLIVFDVDGTLLDSAGQIVECAMRAFDAEGLARPDARAVRRTIGLSLEASLAQLTGGAVDAAGIDRLVVSVRREAMAMREQGVGAGGAQLFDGAKDALRRLHADPPTLLGVATGKGRKGLEHMLDSHALRGLFVTTHTAGEHPPKPNPEMMEAALRATGVSPQRAVMVGDTTYDVEMAREAGVISVGVDWGGHERDELMDAGAHSVIDSFSALDRAVAAALGA